MCNAHNHPPGCTCGWGGDGHLGGGGGGGSSYGGLFYSSYFDTVSSYTDPNAQCPVCGAAVFFYQSPYGGRVFFDELGPPWPKHPCTDNNYSYLPVYSTTGGQARNYGWQSGGWKPILNVFVRDHDEDTCYIRLDADTVIFFPFSKSVLPSDRPLFAQLKEVGNETHVSLYWFGSGATELIGLRSLEDLSNRRVRLEKVRSNVYRFLFYTGRDSGYFKCNYSRLHKPQPLFGTLGPGAASIKVLWEGGLEREFTCFSTADQALNG